MLNRKVLAQAGAGPLGVAISGGSDSTALLLLLHEAGLPVIAATVDHGLRDGSGAEAEAVATLCASLGISHDILTWRREQSSGNLQSQARAARHELLADWIREKGGSAVVLGHTRDDLAETLLMRLERGSGLDGLAAMRAVRAARGITWLRPLLGTGRAELRAMLTQRGIAWCEDPSNDDPRFSRSRLRAQIAALELDRTHLAQTALRLRGARDVVDEQAVAFTKACATQTPLGELVIARAVFASGADDLRLRLLREALVWMNGRDHAPRHDKVERLDTAIRAGQAATLAGVQVRARGGSVHLRREAARIGETPMARTLWDHRWHVQSASDQVEVRALSTLPRADWPNAHSPQPAELMASVPALIAAGGEVVTPMGAASLRGRIRLEPFILLAQPR